MFQLKVIERNGRVWYMSPLFESAAEASIYAAKNIAEHRTWLIVRAQVAA